MKVMQLNDAHSKGKSPFRSSHFRMEPPLAQGLDILRRYVDAGDLPSDPCGPCGDATPAAADIEQLPVAEGRGETPEGELVPSLVGLEASCGIEDIWRNCGYGGHRWRNLEWKYGCRFIKTGMGGEWYGGAALGKSVKSP